MFGASLRQPPPETDLMTNSQWCCETNLFATEALAALLQVELPSVETYAARESRGSAAAAHLVQSLAALPTEDEFTRYKLRMLFRLARHTARVGEIGAETERGDLDDLHALLGRRPASWREGEAELERFVLADAAVGHHDVALVQLFHKRNLRAQMLLGPAGSAMARHATIQRFA